MSAKRIRRRRSHRYCLILQRLRARRQAQLILAGVVAGLAGLAAAVPPAGAAITNWNTSSTIPGTESITPGPSCALCNWNTPSHNLQYADLPSFDLHNTSFSNSWLDSARFMSANLTSANFEIATLSGADFTGATIAFARLVFTPTFTQGQLASTASYQSYDLTGVAFSYDDLSDWNLANQNLTGANFDSATLLGADFTSAQIAFASFNSTTAHGFSASQLYATASYHNLNLAGIRLQYDAMASWNLESQNLASANLLWADLSGANLNAVSAPGAVLLSTNLTGAQLVGANLDNTYLFMATLTSADLRSAAVRGANLANVTWTAANLDLADLRRATNFNGAATAASQRGMISADGTVSGFNLNSSETWLIRPDSQAVTVDGTIAIANNAEAKIDGSVVGIQAGKSANWNLAAGGKVTLVASGAAVLRASSLQLAGSMDNWTATVDVNDNKVIVDNADGVTAAASADRMANQFGQVFNSGAWDGTGGITSTKAKNAFSNDGLAVTVGIVNNGNPGDPVSPLFYDHAGDLGQFAGQDVTAYSTLVKYTYFGDSNLDGIVTTDDYGLFLAGYGDGTPGSGFGSGWAWGDYDYNGVVNIDDYSWFLFGFGADGHVGQPLGAAGGPTSVPEPASLGLIAVSGAGLLLTRRFHR